MNNQLKKNKSEEYIRNMKVTFFDVAAKNQQKMDVLENAMAANQEDPDRELGIQNLWAKYHNATKACYGSVTSLAEAIRDLDDCSKEYSELMRESDEKEEVLSSIDSKEIEPRIVPLEKVVDGNQEVIQEVDPSKIEMSSPEPEAVMEEVQVEEQPEELVAEEPEKIVEPEKAEEATEELVEEQPAPEPQPAEAESQEVETQEAETSEEKGEETELTEEKPAEEAVENKPKPDDGGPRTIFVVPDDENALRNAFQKVASNFGSGGFISADDSTEEETDEEEKEEGEEDTPTIEITEKESIDSDLKGEVPAAEVEVTEKTEEQATEEVPTPEIVSSELVEEDKPAEEAKEEETKQEDVEPAVSEKTAEEAQPSDEAKSVDEAKPADEAKPVEAEVSEEIPKNSEMDDLLVDGLVKIPQVKKAEEPAAEVTEESSLEAQPAVEEVQPEEQEVTDGPLIPMEEEKEEVVEEKKEEVQPLIPVVEETPELAEETLELGEETPQQEVTVVEKEPEMTRFKKSILINDRAILVNQSQAAKLRESRETQKALVHFDRPVAEQTTEQQIEQMMEEITNLYEAGQTKEAEALSEKVSVLSKSLKPAV